MTARLIRNLVATTLLLLPAPLFAQQTGSIAGKVTASDGSALPGVTVEAKSNVLPTPRVTVTGSTGTYRVPALPPGTYTITFTLSGMQPATRPAQIALGVEVLLDVALGVAGVAENITVTAETSIVNRESATLTNTLSADKFRNLPIAQDYRDLLRFIPGVQQTSDLTRGPSNGGSGQDNVYKFDGVNVTLPLYGTLSAEPASHDVAEVTTTKGGARAVDFNRSGGFTFDSISKSGTNRYTGMASLQFQTGGMAADVVTGTSTRYEQARNWTTVNFGGPVLKNKLFFYASYYAPNVGRELRANDYGPLPDYDSNRDEGYGKVTYTPFSSVLINGSFRSSHRLDSSDLFASNAAASTGTGSESWLKIGAIDGSWVVNPRSLVSFKFTYFGNRTQGRPDNESPATVLIAPGGILDIAALDTQGRLTVPLANSTNAAANAFRQQYIDRYGFVQNGVKVGGGLVGYGPTFDKDDFFRNGGEVAYNYSIPGTISHDLHAGYQRYTDSEELTRSSNGWGAITVPGGSLSFNGTPIFFTAEVQQLGLPGVPRLIHAEYRSQSLEFNDTIKWKNWSFDAGIVMSNDTMYGQGLTEDPSTLSGYRLSTGTTPEDRQYKMYEIGFGKMMQPRFGATWSYNNRDTVFASYARYNPATSSLPRAASWDRNLAATVNAHFDANGVLFGVTPIAGSSGKLFVDDLTPRVTHEVLFGTARQFGTHLTGRAYGRYRASSHFWEDTNNNARVIFEPPADIPRELYIPDLTAKLAQIGSGSSYVIAELDGAYSRYHEATFEAEYRTAKMFVSGSYTWSHYFGNFDQDNTTGIANDMNTFVGSSNVGDGAGRQLWNFRDGDLHGDRPHLFKVFGFYSLSWNATAGAYLLAQSGQPWETNDHRPYLGIGGNSSTNDSARFSEPAGSHRTDPHYQVDLSYTQNFKVGSRQTVQFVADLFNIFDRQTGTNVEPRASLSNYGQARTYFDPRRLQLAVRYNF